MTRNRRGSGFPRQFFRELGAIPPVAAGRTTRRPAPVAGIALNRGILWAILALATLAIAPEVAYSSSSEPEIGRFKAHVATLASSEFGGRRGPGALKAALYVSEHLRRCGLEPLFGRSFFQEIPDLANGGVLGRNVGAKIVGGDPALRDEWLIVSAHFDHLGRGPGGYYPGADDNATGTAMMLEVARCFATEGVRPKRSIMFIGFDREEDGLWGSRYFADYPPIPLDRVKLFVTADMIGRSLAGVCDEFVFVFGAQTSPGMKARLDRASAGEPLRLAAMGNDLLIVDRSDYGPFRQRATPYLFFSTGENPDYHRRSDRSETIDFAKAVSVAKIVRRAVAEAASADLLPPWNGQTEASLEEALVVRDVLRRFDSHRDKLAIGPASRLVLRSSLATLDGITARGAITAAERSRLVRAAQFLMVTVVGGSPIPD